MAKHGKKYKAALAKVDLEKEYSVREAVALAKDTSVTKFDSTVEVHSHGTRPAPGGSAGARCCGSAEWFG